MIVDNASMWNVILITDPPSSSIKSRIAWLLARRKSLNVQLSRSKECLLDVAIDFWNMEYSPKAMRKEIRRLGPPGLERQDEVEYWLEETSFARDPEERYLAPYTALLILIGAEDPSIEKWRRLYVKMPRTGREGWIWTWFYRRSPALISLELSGPSNSVRPFGGSFPCPNAIIELAVAGRFSLNDAPKCPQLRTLRLMLDQDQINWRTLPCISRFPVLEELCIHYISEFDYEESDIEPVAISHLSHLRLCGRIPEIILESLQIGTISKLSIQEAYFPFDSIPFSGLFSAAKSIEINITYDHDS